MCNHNHALLLHTATIGSAHSLGHGRALSHTVTIAPLMQWLSR
jgi:hypothetical protein